MSWQTPVFCTPFVAFFENLLPTAFVEISRKNTAMPLLLIRWSWVRVPARSPQINRKIKTLSLAMRADSAWRLAIFCRRLAILRSAIVRAMKPVRISERVLAAVGCAAIALYTAATIALAVHFARPCGLQDISTISGARLPSCGPVSSFNTKLDRR